MGVIPAREAGVREVVVCSPPRPVRRALQGGHGGVRAGWRDPAVRAGRGGGGGGDGVRHRVGAGGERGGRARQPLGHGGQAAGGGGCAQRRARRPVRDRGGGGRKRGRPAGRAGDGRPGRARSRRLGRADHAQRPPSRRGAAGAGGNREGNGAPGGGHRGAGLPRGDHPHALARRSHRLCPRIRSRAPRPPRRRSRRGHGGGGHGRHGLSGIRQLGRVRRLHDRRQPRPPYRRPVPVVFGTVRRSLRARLYLPARSPGGGCLACASQWPSSPGWRDFQDTPKPLLQG